MRVRSLLERMLPGTLRAKLLLLSLVVVTVPIVTAGYVFEVKGRDALIEEKQTKLFGLTRILDANLAGDFDDLLAGYGGDPADRKAKIAFLNARLKPFTDAVAEANPGVGVGYYSKSLNAIVTYGPSRDYADKVGLSIPPDHPGWKVLQSGEKAVESGPQVRGQIMNAMWPIRRGGRVVGYIWANEFSDAINRQAAMIDRAVLMVSLGGIVLGLALVHIVSTRISRDVASIKDGLAALRFDIRKPIAGLRGEFGEIVAAINDMAKALADARSLNDNIFNSIADGVIAIDTDGRVTSINTAAQQMMDISPNEVVDRPYQSIFRPGAKFTSVLLDTLETGREHLGITLAHPLPKKTLYVSASSSLLRDGMDAVIGAVVVIKDLSEQHRLQTQIMRADRLAALGELMAGIAHEIRNPLTSIRGFMQHLQASDDVKEWQQYAPLVVRQVDSLNRIITELLEFSRHRAPRFGLVRVNDLIRDVTLLAGHKWSAEISLDLSPETPLIEADGEALKQVILNLILNAIQALSDGGRVSIRTRSDGPDEVAISVADNGCGISPEDLEKVFDPFFSTKPTGTGLGLAMVRRIIDGHDGRVEIASTPGAGTEVTLHLPLIHKIQVHEA